MEANWRRNSILVGTPARALGLAATLLAGGVLLAWARRHNQAESAGRLKLAGAAIMAGSVLVDSTIGHSQGNFFRRLMLIPPPTAAATLAACLPHPRRWGFARRAVLMAATGIGVVGDGFHTYNVGKRPGGFTWENHFYSAPIAAPSALSLAGLLALSADRDGPLRRLARSPRLLLALTALGLAGNVAEVAMLHYRGAFHNDYMVLPLVVPALAAGALAAAAAVPAPGRNRLAARLLGATGLTGMLGMVFHGFGIHRNMGGWWNASQMVVQGPPLGAPPSFAALALAGLAGLAEMEA